MAIGVITRGGNRVRLRSPDGLYGLVAYGRWTWAGTPGLWDARDRSPEAHEVLRSVTRCGREELGPRGQEAGTQGERGSGDVSRSSDGPLPGREVWYVTAMGRGLLTCSAPPFLSLVWGGMKGRGQNDESREERHGRDRYRKSKRAATGRKTSLSDVQMCLSGRGLSTTQGKGHLFILVWIKKERGETGQRESSFTPLSPP